MAKIISSSSFVLWIFTERDRLKSVLFDINHAGHVHFVRNAYSQLSKQGYKCYIVASDKPLVYALLKEYDIPYHPMGSIGKSLISKLFRLCYHNLKLLFFCIRNRPKLILGIVAIRGSHVGWLLKIKSIVFSDTEHAKMQIALFKPFANEIHNPNWFTTDLGDKQIRYNGFHELAYLHPNNFNPRKQVLKLLGVKENEDFYILRFVAWDATHDKNQYGIHIETKRKIVKRLSARGKVFISSEYELEDEFKQYEFKIPFASLHDALYYSTLLISEGATTACEAAILGTPTLYINSLHLGYMTYLENEYDLLYHLTDPEKIITKLDFLLQENNLEEKWQQKRTAFLAAQSDTSAYIIDLVKQANA